MQQPPARRGLTRRRPALWPTTSHRGAAPYPARRKGRIENRGRAQLQHAAQPARLVPGGGGLRLLLAARARSPHPAADGEGPAPAAACVSGRGDRGGGQGARPRSAPRHLPLGGANAWPRAPRRGRGGGRLIPRWGADGCRAPDPAIELDDLSVSHRRELDPLKPKKTPRFSPQNLSFLLELCNHPLCFFLAKV